MATSSASARPVARPAPVHPDKLYSRNLRLSSFWLAADPPERWGNARRELQEWVVTGQLRITVGQAFPLAYAAEAHRRLEQRQTQGKLILLPRPARRGRLGGPVDRDFDRPCLGGPHSGVQGVRTSSSLFRWDVSDRGRELSMHVRINRPVPDSGAGWV
ncbi:MAG: zinc-binding dehydrogenase, partial [Anaerolineales bacterium]